MKILKYINPGSTAALATACIFVSVSATMAAAPATVAGTYGTVVIGDLPGMVDRGAELAKKISPGISGEVIRGQLGMMLGDEGMKSIPAGSGLVIVMPQKGQSFLLLETAEGKGETIAGLINKRLGDKAKAVNSKLVAFAMDDTALANASGAMGTDAAALLDGNDDKFIVATVDADLLLKDKGADLDSALKNISGRNNEISSSTQNLIQVAGQMVKSVAKRTDVMTVKIDISGENILLEKSLFPIGGVTLAKPEGVSGHDLSKSIAASDGALVRYESYMDTQSAVSGMNGLFAEIMQAADMTQQDRDIFMGLMKTAGEGFGDAQAGSISMDKDGTNGTYLLSVIDKDKALQYIDDAAKQFEAGGALGRMYTSLGMETSMTLEKNAGTIEGQPVHNFSVSVKPPTGNASLASMNKPKSGKFTVLDDKMIMALGKTSLEGAVSAAKAGNVAGAKELESRAKLPAGAAVYIDYNLAAVAPMVEEQNAEVAEALQGLDGISIIEALYTDADSLKLVIQVPSEMITKGIDAAQDMAQKNQSKRKASSDDADKNDVSDDSDTSATSPATQN